MKSCVILGGGEVTCYSYAKEQVAEAQFIIAADSGYLHAKQMGVVPDLAVGDFDSMSIDLAKGCKVSSCSPYKDDTDTMIAVKTALELGYDSITMIGMLGGRLDHTIANIQSLRYVREHGAQGIIADRQTEIIIVQSGETAYVQPDEGYSLSVFALDSAACGVTIENARYPLENATLTGGFPLGVSNAFAVGTAEVSVGDGCLMVMKCKV